MGRLFGTNGIRGVANKDLTPVFVTKMGTAIGTFFGGGKILVGRDGRTSGDTIESLIQGALASTGCEVFDVGLTPTPTLQYGIKAHGMDGGVLITASHNPPEYNGIKVLTSTGIEITRDQELEIEKIYFEERFRLGSWKEFGSVNRAPDLFTPYREGIKRLIDVDSIRKARLKVVADYGNGVGALVIPHLLEDLGCEVRAINSDVNGTFPGRVSEPRPDTLGELSLEVKGTDADLGVAYDGDADRAIFVNEKGEVYWGDKSLALIEKMYLSRHRGEVVVTPISSSQIVDDIAREYGGEVVWTRVGSVDVSWKMTEIGANLGGEENGGVFYGPHQPVRDGAMTTALILQIMAKTDAALSELIGELPTYFQAKDKVPCPHHLKTKVLRELRSEVKAEKIETIDGVKMWFADRSWVLIRPSGTEPIYRLYVEAKTPERVKELVSDYKRMVKETVEGFRLSGS